MSDLRFTELHSRNNATLREAQMVEAAFDVAHIEDYAAAHPLRVLLRKYGIPDIAFFVDDRD